MGREIVQAGECPEGYVRGGNVLHYGQQLMVFHAHMEGKCESAVGVNPRHSLPQLSVADHCEG